MALFGDLKDKFNNARQDRANKADFKRMLIAAVSDGKLTDSELNAINQLAQQYNIEEEDFLKINVEAYKAAFKAIISDGIITQEEERNIQEIQSILMVDANQISTELQTLAYHRQLRELQQGLPQNPEKNSTLVCSFKKILIIIFFKTIGNQHLLYVFLFRINRFNSS